MEEFGFNRDFDYLRMLMPVVKASNFTVLERAGGLEDQDPAFILDMGTWLMLERWAEEELKSELPPADNVMTRDWR